MVPTQNATSFMDCKEVKRNLCNNITHKKNTCNLFWPCKEKKLEHLMTTGIVEGKHSRGKQQEKILDGLPKWHQAERVTEELKSKLKKR